MEKMNDVRFLGSRRKAARRQTTVIYFGFFTQSMSQMTFDTSKQIEDPFSSRRILRSSSVLKIGRAQLKCSSLVDLLFSTHFVQRQRGSQSPRVFSRSLTSPIPTLSSQGQNCPVSPFLYIVEQPCESRNQTMVPFERTQTILFAGAVVFDGFPFVFLLGVVRRLPCRIAVAQDRREFHH
jgi:hypothetical protein